MVKFTANIDVKMKKDAKGLMKELQALADKRVLVGVPEEADNRDEAGEKRPIGNAALAFIHDNGSPAAGIPARPFMKPGIDKAQNKINLQLRQAAGFFLDGDAEQGEMALHRVGMIGQNAIRNAIEEGENFAPLLRATLLGRIRSRKSLHEYFKNKPWRNDEKFEVISSFKPLIDTGELLKSISYVIEGVG